MSYPNLSALLEAIIYLAKEPVSIDAIHKALPDVDRKSIEECIASLIEKYRMENITASKSAKWPMDCGFPQNRNITKS